MNKKLIHMLAEVFDMKISEINEGLTNEDISNWDSLTQMDLVTSIENEFEIELEMMDIVSLTSIKAIIDTLKNKGINLED